MTVSILSETILVVKYFSNLARIVAIIYNVMYFNHKNASTNNTTNIKQNL